MKSETPLAGQITESRAALAVCGWSGSGKTTLLEAVIPRLIGDGLRVAVVKHDAHGIRLDHPNTDSDRLFSAGADIHLRGPDEVLWRLRPGPPTDLETAIDDLLAFHDLVLVEGHKNTPMPKIWLASPTESHPPAEIDGVLDVLPWGEQRPQRFQRLLAQWLPQQWRQRPCFGGVLLGGTSSRMGCPKHLVRFRGASLLERAVAALDEHVDRVMVLGTGEITEACAGLDRLPDVHGLCGPLAGMLAAARWHPDVAWVFAACDMPFLRSQAVAWLVDQRRPGRWMVVPRRSGKGVEPLCALYEPQAFHLFEDLVRRGRHAPRLLANHDSAWCPMPPASLADAWVNVNTLEELADLERGGLSC